VGHEAQSTLIITRKADTLFIGSASASSG